MDAVQMFALETFLERNYFSPDEEGIIASIGCASFSTYLTNSDEETYCFSLYLGDLIGYEFSLIDEDYTWTEDGLEDRITKVNSLKQLFEDFAGLTVDMTLDERESTEEESEDADE
ncbi:hypothetical protein [Synechocystis sp. PCC 7509]|uniref:hypothetical protein n=1 Tax=Synechocystis sp. PCC 7509 TaxID=927677 RepID=UPI0002AC0AB5|nr:hypothetical protein [Synechocystis sp. PCC 7509]